MAGSASLHPGPSSSLPSGPLLSGFPPAKALRLQQKLGGPLDTPALVLCPRPLPPVLLSLPRNLVLGRLPATSTPPPPWRGHPGHRPSPQTPQDETPRPGCAPTIVPGSPRFPPCSAFPAPRAACRLPPARELWVTGQAGTGTEAPRPHCPCPSSDPITRTPAGHSPSRLSSWSAPGRTRPGQPGAAPAGL